MGRVIGLTRAQRGPSGSAHTAPPLLVRKRNSPQKKKGKKERRITVRGFLLLADFFKAVAGSDGRADEPDAACLRLSGRATNCSAVWSPSFQPLLIRQVHSPSRLRLIIPFCLRLISGLRLSAAVALGSEDPESGLALTLLKYGGAL